MSFDVFLQRFVDGAPAGISRRAVRSVLDAAVCRGPDRFSFFVVAFPDGCEVEFSAGLDPSPEPLMSCAFHIRGFCRGLAGFMLDIARAGDMVMFPVIEGGLLVMVSEAQRDAVPAEVLEAVRAAAVVHTPEELEALLTNGYAAWAAYRNQVVGGPPET